MKRKKCPQCKNLISVNAPTCLYCGRPNKFITKEYVKSKWKLENKKKIKYLPKNIIYFILIFFILFIIIYLIFN